MVFVKRYLKICHIAQNCDPWVVYFDGVRARAAPTKPTGSIGNRVIKIYGVTHIFFICLSRGGKVLTPDRGALRKRKRRGVRRDHGQQCQ